MRNIPLKQYIKLKDPSPYDILEHLKPVNRIVVRRGFLKKRLQMDLNKMPYANVKYCIRLVQKVSSWDNIATLFEICFDLKPDEFWNLPIKQFFAARRHMIREFSKMVESENKLLASTSTDSHLWDMAGADKLKPYNDTLPLLQLGKQFGQYPFDMGRKPYGEIFNLLVQIKVQNEVESEYQKLKTK